MKKDNLSLFLKQLRLDNEDERLSDMARRLGVSISYLSSVETKKRRMTDKMYQKIVEVYNLSKEESKNLKYLRTMASEKVDVSLTEMNEEKKDTVVQFLSNVEELNEEDMRKISKIIRNKSKR